MTDFVILLDPEPFREPTPEELQAYLDLQDWYEMMYQFRAIENDPQNYRIEGLNYHD